LQLAAAGSKYNELGSGRAGFDKNLSVLALRMAPREANRISIGEMEEHWPAWEEIVTLFFHPGVCRCSRREENNEQTQQHLTQRAARDNATP
jgi:hypothetical protein